MSTECYSSLTDFDDKFDQLRLAKIINFYPWVGENYAKNRAVIIGKAHHTASDGSGKANGNNPEYTRQIVFNEAIQKEPKAKIYSETLKMLCPKATPDRDFRKRFFDHIAFFNLAKEQGRSNEAPSVGEAEFQAFWEIARIIKPKRCLFHGIGLNFTSASGKSNKKLLEEIGIRVIGEESKSSAGAKIDTAVLEFCGLFVRAVFCENAGDAPYLGDDFSIVF